MIVEEPKKYVFFFSNLDGFPSFKCLSLLKNTALTELLSMQEMLQSKSTMAKSTKS